jgi:hypothetical protein
LIPSVSINKKWRRSLCDVRNRRGTDIYGDHYLVIAEVRIKIAATRKKFQKRAKLLDVRKLKDRSVKKEFKIQLRNKYEQLANEEEENKAEDDCAIVEDTIENKWDKIKATLLTVSEETLGYKEQERKDWISAESWKLIK